jgi:hypothetical protein
MMAIAGNPVTSSRARIASSTTGEIITMVHARLGARDARAQFEAARYALSHDELVDLAMRTIEGAG